MSGKGYTISNQGVGGGEEQKHVVVSPADGTIDVERVESDNEVDFKIRTTYDGYETIDTGSPYGGGYFRAIHIKFNAENRRYRLVCILNGGSYTPVAKDFAFYYIKFGWRTGGVNADHWYIEEFSRQGNGAFVALEQIALNEYNVLINTPTGYAYANIGILKEDKEPDVTIEHFNPQNTRYTPTGTIIKTEIPSWRNGAPAVWQIIPNIANPTVGQLGHYYNGDRNLYFFDGYNWHNVYALSQGVAQCLATTDAPAIANDGTIYYDTTEEAIKIWINGGWQNILFPVAPNKTQAKQVVGALCMNNTSGYNSVIQIWSGSAWDFIQAYAIGFVQMDSSYEWSTNNACGIQNNKLKWYVNNTLYEAVTKEQIMPQVVTFTDYPGETIAANDTDKIIVTAAFGANSILDITNIEKVDGKTIEITILSSSIIRVKDGAIEKNLNGCNDSVVKCICINNKWSFYKVSWLNPVQ